MNLHASSLSCAISAAALLTAGCAAPPGGEPAGSETIDRRYRAMGFRTSGGNTVIVASRLYGQGDRTVICGAFGVDRAANAENTINMTQSRASVKHGDVVIVSNLYGFAGPYENTDIRERESRCTLTNVPWRSEFTLNNKLRLVLPRTWEG